MAQYRRIPYIVDAYKAGAGSYRPAWVQEEIKKGTIIEYDNKLIVRGNRLTANSSTVVRNGDYIIRHREGEIGVIGAEYFNENYEEVKEGDA